MNAEQTTVNKLDEIKRLKAENPELGFAAIGRLVGCTRQYAFNVIRGPVVKYVKQKRVKNSAMEPEQFRAILLALGWTQRWLADYLNLPRSTVQRWGDGTARIPVNVAVWLLELARQHALIPLPDGWRK